MKDIQTLKDQYRAHLETHRTACDSVKERRKFLDETISRLEVDFDNENAELILTRDSALSLANEAESQLRDAAIAHFNETGQKTLDENLGVQVRTKLIYEMPAAVVWAEQNVPMFVVKSVDKKAFEALPNVTALDFVRSEQTASAVIKGLK